jgi:hypothetical protein
LLTLSGDELRANEQAVANEVYALEALGSSPPPTS